LCDTALGAYDPERDLCDTALGHTMQSKLTVQAPAMGSGVPTICAVLGAMVAAHILVRCPVSGVGSLNGSLLGCFRKDVALCHTASRAWNGERRTAAGVDGTFHVHRLREARGAWGSLLGVSFCFRKDVALCHTASRARVGERRTGTGSLGGRHISCAPSA